MYHDNVSPIITHVLSHLRLPRLNHLPLFVALQGPQGIGKSTLTSIITHRLSSPPHSVRIVALSLDDFYLPHQALRALGGRGPPGTHDLPLAVSVLRALQAINRSPRGMASVTLPRFNKSAYGGEGDRKPAGEVVHGPVDVVILEGWCVGFLPISEAELERRCNLGVDTVGVDMRRYDVDELKLVNEHLKKYREVWNFFDVLVQVCPSSIFSRYPFSSQCFFLDRFAAQSAYPGVLPHPQVEA
jgi:D-glycerate 3-kinase